ncbi:UDP-glycosyltransferase 71E1 [Artemisia annua]|uniref:UDP-glycosyltransferase 71E1 n=1 Tax=Artemisia annua TaxID=35608 RepID=A0A2U1NAJ5_ARTAN|nr:UDP-glycosyltransferase 71E1 [Artemisia annua]
MTTSELIFIPSPGDGHLPSMVEFAKLLLDRDQRLSITIIIMNLPLQPKHNIITPTPNSRLCFVEIPSDESTKDLISPNTYIHDFVKHHKTHVLNIVHEIFESGKAKHDEGDHDITRFKDSDLQLPIPSYVNVVPVKILPAVVFDMEGGFEWFLYLARKFRETKGILVNIFQELDSHTIDSLIRNMDDIPPFSVVGPILNIRNIVENSTTHVEIMAWLSNQPESLVQQVNEIAVAIERSGHRFLWSLRCPLLMEKSWIVPIEHPQEYENLNEFLPEGFLERTSSMGKIIGWAPQMEVLSHSSIGGFFSHCGWNSVLESIWCGVPIAAWPLYAEQQLNAFQLVVDMGIAAPIGIDSGTIMSR